jgi:hypothetical protein
MTKTRTLLAGLTIAIASLLTAGAAYALNDKSYLKVGTNGACTLGDPCGSLSTAVAQTNPNGVITFLDSGDYFDIATISKSLTFDGTGTSVTVFRIIVDGPDVTLTIRGIHFFGTGSEVGIDFQNGAALIIEDSTLRHYFRAVNFAPGTAAKLFVRDVLVTESGSGSVGGGIIVAPRSGGSAQVSLERATVVKGVFGMVADGSSSTAGINMTIWDSVSSGNSQDGIIATTSTGGAPIGVMVSNTASANNGFGIRSIGPNVTVRVENSKVIGNGTGVTSLNGGGLVTFGNNVVRANGTDGGFTAAAGLQ